MIRRSGFRDLVRRQLDLFEQEEAELIRDAEAAMDAYDRAEREDAEELYGDYLLQVEAGTEALAALRDTYVRTLEEGAEHEYIGVFNRAARKRFRRLSQRLDNT